MNANQFLKAVEQLQGWREYVFLLSLAERAFPNFALFSEAIGQKGGARMRQLLDQAWEGLREKPGEEVIPRMLSRPEALAPDVDKHDVYGVYPAFDFCQLLEQALLSRLNPDHHRASQASSLATGTVMGFVEMTEGEGLGDDELVRLFDQHPLMKEDKVFQREVVLSVKRQRTPTEDYLEDLRDLAVNQGVSNLGISLEE